MFTKFPSEEEDILFCLCEEKNGTGTYHIFENCKETSYGCHTFEDESVCGKIDNNNLDCLLTCRDKNTMRTKIAKYANEGKNICGVCVSHLYENEY